MGSDGWEVRTSQDTWFLAVEEIHVKPVNDVILHGWSGCVCGPEDESQGNVIIYRHHALDGREFAEVEG